MIFLLSDCSVFIPLARGCYTQACGTPISKISNKSSPSTSVSTKSSGSKSNISSSVVGSHRLETQLPPKPVQLDPTKRLSQWRRKKLKKQPSKSDDTPIRSESPPPKRHRSDPNSKKMPSPGIKYIPVQEIFYYNSYGHPTMLPPGRSFNLKFNLTWHRHLEQVETRICSSSTTLGRDIFHQESTWKVEGPFKLKSQVEICRTTNLKFRSDLFPWFPWWTKFWRNITPVNSNYSWEDIVPSSSRKIWEMMVSTWIQLENNWSRWRIHHPRRRFYEMRIFSSFKFRGNLKLNSSWVQVEFSRNWCSNIQVTEELLLFWNQFCTTSFLLLCGVPKTTTSSSWKVRISSWNSTWIRCWNVGQLEKTRTAVFESSHVKFQVERVAMEFSERRSRAYHRITTCQSFLDFQLEFNLKIDSLGKMALLDLCPISRSTSKGFNLNSSWK